MDVHCSSCREPWEVWHLCHDAVHETEMTEDEAAVWLELPRSEQLSTHHRDFFAREGWEFGGSLLHVRSCPACPEGAEPESETDAMRAAIVSALGDDLDAIAATFADEGL